MISICVFALSSTIEKYILTIIKFLLQYVIAYQWAVINTMKTVSKDKEDIRKILVIIPGFMKFSTE